MEPKRSGQSISQWYQLALENNDIHKCTNMDLLSVNVRSLFLEDNALKFIKKYFSYYTVSNSKNDPSEKIMNSIGKITEFRARHTVAAFLLGITVKEELSFDIRDWIRIYDSHSSDQSFGFFWSIVCLLHDTGYFWERNSKKYIEKYATLDAFCADNGITYNLLNYTDNEFSGLIKNYYKYSINIRQKLDHGIVGGILIFDALMSLYKEAEGRNDFVLCGIKIRNNFPMFALRIAETVARHNMWTADKNNAHLYKDYNLFALIPNDNKDTLVYYSDDKLLFLLGLIDTIDPIKAFCNTEGGRKALDAAKVLDDIEISFRNRSDKQITISGNGISFEDYKTTVDGLKKWLGVDVYISKEDKVDIALLKRTGVIKKIA